MSVSLNGLVAVVLFKPSVVLAMPAVEAEKADDDDDRVVPADVVEACVLG